MADPTRADIEDIFGVTNVSKWADLDNDQSAAKITARIARAIVVGVAWFQAKMRGGPYAVPMVTTDPLVVEIQARWAGIWLYGPRRVTESGEDDLFRKSHLEDCESKVKEILAGRITLDAPRVRPGGGHLAPFVSGS